MTSPDWPPRPRLSAAYYKAHGLGNDYLVFSEDDRDGVGWLATPAAVSRVCDRTRGVGSDGIVVLSPDVSDGRVRLRMFNPDGSEFERSGNGLRILASYLHRQGRVAGEPFEVEVGGGVVRMIVHARHGTTFDVSVAMGHAKTGAPAVALDPGALDDEGHLPGPYGGALDLTPVWVGNPHLVVFGEPLTAGTLETVGLHLAGHPALANGANVQLARSDSGQDVLAMIWERGVGPTSASGTSACAVAVAAVQRGLVAPGSVSVQMEGGVLSVHVTEDFEVTLRGPVEEVLEGSLTGATVEALNAVSA